MSEDRTPDMIAILPGLAWALNLLTDAYTTDEPELVGFVVCYTPDTGRYSPADFIEAWRIVRMSINRPVNPTPIPADEVTHDPQSH